MLVNLIIVIAGALLSGVDAFPHASPAATSTPTNSSTTAPSFHLSGTANGFGCTISVLNMPASGSGGKLCDSGSADISTTTSCFDITQYSKPVPMTCKNGVEATVGLSTGSDYQTVELSYGVGFAVQCECEMTASKQQCKMIECWTTTA